MLPSLNVYSLDQRALTFSFLKQAIVLRFSCVSSLCSKLHLVVIWCSSDFCIPALASYSWMLCQSHISTCLEALQCCLFVSLFNNVYSVPNYPAREDREQKWAPFPGWTEHPPFLFPDRPAIAILTVSGSLPIRRGENITLTCQADGSPAASYTWRLPNASNVIFIGNNSTVIIVHADGQNNGVYECTASNKHGQQHSQVEIQVEGKTRVYASFANDISNDILCLKMTTGYSRTGTA